MTLSDRINQFIEKQVRVGSESELRQYGIKIPEGQLKPLHPEYRPEPKKLPKVQKPMRPPKRTEITKKPRKFEPKVSGVVEEVAHQLTPKGPYRSAQDIAQDVEESKRLARKITRVKKLEKKVE